MQIFSHFFYKMLLFFVFSCLKKHVLAAQMRAAGREGQPAEVAPHDAEIRPLIMARDLGAVMG